MAGSIANLNVKLTASIGSFAASMTSAAKPLAGFAGKVGAASMKLASFAGAATALVAGGSLLALVNNSLDSIDALKDQADALGVSTDALSRLQYAAKFAGVENEALGGALQKMLKNVNEAQAGSGGAADAFRTLGLDAAKLAAMAPDAAFREIAGAMESIENPAQRVGLAMDLFGKSGVALLPVLANGKDGLAAMADEADKLGVTIKATDAAKIEAANDAMDRMKGAITGAANTVAVQLAPFIAVAADKLTDFATSGDGLTGKVVSGFEAVVKAVAYASDYLSLAKSGFKLLQSGATYAVFGVVKAVDWLGKKLVDLINLLPGMEVEWTDFTGGLADGLLDEARKLSDEAGAAFDAFDRGDNAKAVGRFFDDVRTKADGAAKAAVEAGPKIGAAFQGMEDDSKGMKKVADALAEIRKELDQFGMGDSQKKLADLKALGASPEQLAAADDSLKKLDAMNAAKKKADELQQKGAAVIDATRTPLQKYDSKIGELSSLLGAGAIDWDTYGRAVRDARKELEEAGAAKVAEAPNAPDLFTAGSAAAQKFIFDQTRGIQRLTRDDVPKEQLAEAKDANRTLERIEANTRTRTTDEIEVLSL
jgi:hypothetical protein